MFSRFRRGLGGLIGDDAGTTAIEYGLIVALISLGALVGIRVLGDAVFGQHNSVSTTIANALLN